MEPDITNIETKGYCAVCGCDLGPNKECPCECHLGDRPPQISTVLFVPVKQPVRSARAFASPLVQGTTRFAKSE